MLGNLRMGINRITGLADGVSVRDAATVAQTGYFKRIAGDLVKTADFTVTAEEAGASLIGNSEEPISFTLPEVSTVENAVFLIRNIGAGSLTIDPNGSQKINGADSLVLETGDSAMIWASEELWRAIFNAEVSEMYAASIEEMHAGTVNKLPAIVTIREAMDWIEIAPGASVPIDHAEGVNRTLALRHPVVLRQLP